MNEEIKHVILTANTYNRLINYLINKPYAEVANLMTSIETEAINHYNTLTVILKEIDPSELSIDELSINKQKKGDN